MLRPSSLRLALLVAGAAALSGCHPFRTSLRHDELIPGARFTWRDARHPSQKGSTTESLMVTSCAYGIYRIGDAEFTPDRVAVLRSDLERALGAELAGRTVALRSYTVHLNCAESLRKGVASNNKGLVAALMNDTSVHGCKPDDLRGGFAGKERTTPFSPLVVVIDVEVDGKLVHARWVESPPKELGGARGDEKSPWHDFVSRAVRSATSRLVDNLRTTLRLAAR